MVYIRYDHRKLPLEKKWLKHQPSDSVVHSDEILPSINSSRRSEELFDGYLGEGRFNHVRKINFFKNTRNKSPKNALKRYETDKNENRNSSVSLNEMHMINIDDNDNHSGEKNFHEPGSLNNLMRKIENEKKKRQQDRMSEEFAEIKTRVSNILNTFRQSCSDVHKNLLNSQDIILHRNNSQQYRISEILANYSELCIDREDILRNVFFSSIETNCEKQLQDSTLENVEDISSEISTAMEGTNARLKILQNLFKRFVAMRCETNLFQISKKKDRELHLKKLVTEQFKKLHKLKLEQKEKLDTWKFAANEVVEVLRSVRQEGLADFQRLEEEFLKLVQVFNTQKEILEDTVLKLENHKTTMQKLQKEKEINKVEHANLQDEYERCRMNLKSAQKKCTSLEVTLNETILKCTNLQEALQKATDIAEQLTMYTKNKNLKPDTVNPVHQSNDKLEKTENIFVEEKKKSKVLDLKLKNSSALIDHKTELNYRNEIFDEECSKCVELSNKITLLNAEIITFKNQNFANIVSSSQQTKNVSASFEDREISHPFDNQFFLDGGTQIQLIYDNKSAVSNQSQILMENKSSLVQPISKECVLDVSTQTQPFDITFETNKDCRSDNNVSTSTCDLIHLNSANEQIESTLVIEILSLAGKIKDVIKNNDCLMKKISEPLIDMVSIDSKKCNDTALVNSQNSVAFKKSAVGINFENIADIPSFYRPICEQEPVMQRKWTESGFFEESNLTNYTAEKNEIHERKSVADLPNQILHFLSELANCKCSYLSDKVKALITQDICEEEAATKELYMFAEHAIDLLHTIAFVLSQTQGKLKKTKKNSKIKLPDIRKNQKYENLSSTPLTSTTKRELQVALSSTSKAQKNKRKIKLPDIPTPNRQSNGNARHYSTSEVKKTEKVLERKRAKIFSRHNKMIEKLRASGVGMKQIYTILGISYSNNEADFLEGNASFEFSGSSSRREPLDMSNILSTGSNYQPPAKTASKQLDKLIQTIEPSTYLGKFENKKRIPGKLPQKILNQFNTADNARLIFPPITSKASDKEDFFTNNFFNTKGLSYPRR